MITDDRNLSTCATVIFLTEAKPGEMVTGNCSAKLPVDKCQLCGETFTTTASDTFTTTVSGTQLETFLANKLTSSDSMH